MHDHFHHGNHVISTLSQFLLALPFLLGLMVYLLAVVFSNRKYKKWPVYRTICWVVGITLVLFTVAGPLAEQAHTDFTIHMLGHLFLGMLGPLIMVLAAPMTLFMRILPVIIARRVSRLLKHAFFRVVTDPIVASLLNVGGLWILYTTDLYSAMHHSFILHVLVHMHVFLAGYLFTISMINVDLIPHRTSYVYRSIVLVLAIAAHGILSKFIYANPPTGVSPSQAELGGMLMYYGGDVIDIIIIFILCSQWYRDSRPKMVRGYHHYSLR
ncbi:cytochrome c oxidase assembly protein [Halalkalibacter alkalisediminis]|uniref:Cytochrome c oxidase assembly protein n=1 Tax=Halalkalibacter alkalisediminis TaxID=935616 RepID=A0ABV6NIA8_9BACI|nr:cytochrome c oxidase assembly protein [Halalkalibacter alkalisediminis]